MDGGPKILFLGTPEFAVASLGALLMNNFNIVGVVTSPDKPAGRGQKVKRSAVAKYASDNFLKLLQPPNLKDPGFIKELHELAPDIAVVVAFRKLPSEVWKIPVKGTFNLHASLLPQYRGAAPINHAIINGETSTGITTFLIDDKIDTGNILLRKELLINHTDNAGELHDRLMRSGAGLVVSTVELLATGKAEPVDQMQFVGKNEPLKPAPKIYSKDCFIEWTASSETVYNMIRGLSPSPGARTIFSYAGKEILFKILESSPELISHKHMPGTIISDGKANLKIATQDGFIEILKLQPEGKKGMKTADYLRGTDITSWSVSTARPV